MQFELKHQLKGARKYCKKVKVTLVWCTITIFLIIALGTFISTIMTSSVFMKQHSNKIDSSGSIEQAIVHAFDDLLLNIFIRPLSWLLDQLIKVIYFIGSGNLSQKLMFDNANSRWGLPPIFWISIWISLSLIVIFLGYKLIYIMIASYSKQSFLLKTTLRNVICLLLFAPLIPTVFFLANQIIAIIISYLTKGETINLGLLIFKSSFQNGININILSIPNNWNFNDNNNFSYLICIVADFILAYVLVMTVMSLLIRIFELLWLFVTTFFVMMTIIGDTDNSYRYFKNHNNLVIQRWLIFVGMFIAIDLFLNLIPAINHIAQSLKSPVARPVFILLGIFSAAMLILQVPTLISASIGSISSLTDNMGHARNMKKFSSFAWSSVKMGKNLFKFNHHNKADNFSNTKADSNFNSNNNASFFNKTNKTNKYNNNKFSNKDNELQKLLEKIKPGNTSN